MPLIGRAASRALTNLIAGAACPPHHPNNPSLVQRCRDTTTLGQISVGLVAWSSAADGICCRGRGSRVRRPSAAAGVMGGFGLARAGENPSANCRVKYERSYFLSASLCLSQVTATKFAELLYHMQ
jgi:hypothetical protein